MVQAYIRRDPTLVNRPLCKRKRLSIARKSARIASVNMPGELVEQQDQSQASMRLLGPIFQFVVKRLLDSRIKSLSDRGVKRRVFGKPLFGRGFFKPEVKNLSGRIQTDTLTERLAQVSQPLVPQIASRFWFAKPVEF